MKLCLCRNATIIKLRKNHTSLSNHHHHQPSHEKSHFFHEAHLWKRDTNLIPTREALLSQSPSPKNPTWYPHCGAWQWRKWKLRGLCLCEKVFSLSLFIALQEACWLFPSRGHKVFVYFGFLTVCWSLSTCICLWFTLWSLCSSSMTKVLSLFLLVWQNYWNVVLLIKHLIKCCVAFLYILAFWLFVGPCLHVLVCGLHCGLCVPHVWQKYSSLFLLV